MSYGQTQSKYIFSFAVVQVRLPTKIKVPWFSVCIAAVSLCEWKPNPTATQEPGWQRLSLQQSRGGVLQIIKHRDASWRGWFVLSLPAAYQ